MSTGRGRNRALATAVFAAGVALTMAVPASAEGRQPRDGDGRFAVNQVNLISDLSTVGAKVVDPDVVNPWGLALGPTTPLWSANNATSSATLYSSPAGTATAALVGAVRVTVPLPTGQVFNPTSGFVTSNAGTSGPARFIFSTLTGQIAAWSNVAGPLMGAAQIPRTVPGAAYTGLALAMTKSGPQLYAANFAQGRIDVFDSMFASVTLPANRFRDSQLPAGYSPFNVTTLRNRLFVAYAKVDPVTHRNAVGRGLGVVDEYNANGRLLARIASRGTLDAPWGMAIAPASWGELAGSLLVGNFGDGRINVISSEGHGQFDDEIGGLLKNATTGRTLVIPGLWALLAGTDPVPATATTPASSGTGGSDSIWFSAGIDNERHGLIGVLRAPVDNDD